MTPQQVGLLAIGLLACFMGYSMFRSMLPLWGFILGGWIAYIMMPSIIPAPQSGELLYVIGAFVIGGLIGALIATPLYYVIIFLSGGALGMMAGVMIGALLDMGGISSFRELESFINMSFPPIPHTFWQYAFVFIFGALLGVAALSFQRFMVSASSAFLGAAAIVSGLSGSLMLVTPTSAGRAVTMLLGWFVIALIGLFVQYRLTGEV